MILTQIMQPDREPNPVCAATTQAQSAHFTANPHSLVLMYRVETADN